MTYDVFRCIFFAVEKREREENETVAEVLSLFQNKVPAVSGNLAIESTETLKLFWNEVVEQVLRSFLGHDSERKDISYVQGTIIANARGYALVANVGCCLLK